MFLVGCMGTRTLLVYLAATVPLAWLKVMGALAAVIATGFAVIHTGGLRKSGPETGGEPIWWDSLRPVHAILYAAFAYTAWVGERQVAWRVLLLDVVIGLVSFVLHHRDSLCL